MHHEVSPEKREQHVAAAEDDRANFQENQEQRPHCRRNCCRGAGSDCGDKPRSFQSDAAPQQSEHAQRYCMAFFFREIKSVDQGNRCPGPSQYQERVDAKKTKRNTDHTGDGEQAALDRRPPEPPQCLQNHGDHYRLHSIQKPGHCRQMSEAHVRPGDACHQNRRGKNEAHAAHEQSHPAGAQIANVNGQFA